MAARSLLLLVGSLVLTSCFGTLSIGANLAVEPHILLPGNTVTLTLDVQGDGLLGNAMHQQLTPAAFTNSGVVWDVRDNSDADKVRVRATSSADFPATFDSTSMPAMNGGAVNITTADFVVYRTYALRVTVPPTQTATPSTDSISQQAAAAALAGVHYQWSARLPGTISTTNGFRSDDGRIVWNLDIAAKQTQVLTAGSTYIDIPRVAVFAILLGLLVVFTLVGRTRTTRPPAEAGAGPTTSA